MKFTILAISKCPIQWYIHHVSQTSPPHISRTLCHGRRKLISTRNLFSFLPPLASGDLASHLSVSDFFVLYAIHKQYSIACDHCEWLFSLSLVFPKFIHTLAMLHILHGRNFLLYGFTTLSLFAHHWHSPKIGIWIVSTFSLLETVL